MRVTGDDPYALDADDDGFGCDRSGQGGGAKSPWGLIIQKPPGKEAEILYNPTTATVTVVGWSPRSAKGLRYDLCVVVKSKATHCKAGDRRLSGTVQTFGKWKAARGHIETPNGNPRLFITLVVDGRRKATDLVYID